MPNVTLEFPDLESTANTGLVIRQREPVNFEYPFDGACCCGHADVKEIEVSTDGGASWSAAEFLDEPERFAWRRFQSTWQGAKDANDNRQTR